MTAIRKLTAEQRAAHVWAKPKLRLVQVTPVEQEPEIVSPRVQWIVIALVWVCMLVAFGARMAGWLP